jgi:hypothetical protein
MRAATRALVAPDSTRRIVQEITSLLPVAKPPSSRQQDVIPPSRPHARAVQTTPVLCETLQLEESYS